MRGWRGRTWRPTRRTSGTTGAPSLKSSYLSDTLEKKLRLWHDFFRSRLASYNLAIWLPSDSLFVLLPTSSSSSVVAVIAAKNANQKWQKESSWHKQNFFFIFQPVIICFFFFSMKKISLVFLLHPCYRSAATDFFAVTSTAAMWKLTTVSGGGLHPKRKKELLPKVGASDRWKHVLAHGLRASDPHRRHARQKDLRCVEKERKSNAHTFLLMHCYLRKKNCIPCLYRRLAV